MSVTALITHEAVEPAPGAAEVAPGWEARAACADTSGQLTRLFFSDELPDIAAAKRICADCPVLAQCLEAAVARNEQFGVWGGQLFVGGKVVHFKRARGRPPKNPRPEEHLPQVPIPEHLRERLSA
ncbi:MAG: WhiB family transcriptional regulator [Microthrixaceae bacterium]